MSDEPSPNRRWASVFRRGSDLTTTLIGVIAQGYVLVVGLGVLVLTAKALGPEGRGVIATVTTFLVSLTTIMSFSLGYVVTRVAAGAEAAAWLPRAIGTLLVFTGGVTLVGWIGVGLAMAGGITIARDDIPSSLLALALVALPFGVWELYSTQLLLLLRKAESCSVILVIGRSVYLLLVVGALATGADVYGVILAGVGAQAAIAIAQGWLLLRMAEGPPIWDPALLRRLLPDGLRLHWNFIGDLLLMSASVLFVTAFVGVRGSGLYQAALSLLNVPVVIPQAASMVVVGHIGAHGAGRAWLRQRRLVYGVMALMTAIAIVSAVIGPLVIPRVLGPDFRDAVPVFQILCPLLVSNALIRLMASQWMARGLFRQLSAVALTAGGINVACHWMLVPRFGMAGAAMSLLVAHAAIVIAELWLIALCERERSALVSAEPMSAPETGHP